MKTRRRILPWYHGWNVVAACVFVQACALGLTINAFSLFVPRWTQEFGVPVSTIAVSITLFSVGSAATSWFIGLLSTRYPARWLIGGGLVLLAFVMVLVSQARAAWQITAIYVLLMPLALGFSGAVTSQSLVSRWFLQRAGVPIGLTALGLALGGVIFPPIIVHLFPLIGWRMIWAGMAGMVLLVTLPLALVVLRDKPDPDDPAIYARAQEGRLAGGESMSYREIVGRANFRLVILPFVAMLLITLTIAVDIAPIISSYGGSPAAAGMFLSVFSAAQLAAKLGSGWLADRIGSRVPLALVAAVSGSGAMLLAIPQSGPAFLVGVAILAGAVGAGWTLTAHALLTEFGQATFGRAFGLACTISPLGTFAPPIVAAVEERTGTFAPALLVLGLLAMSAALAVLLFYRNPAPLPAEEPA